MKRGWDALWLTFLMSVLSLLFVVVAGCAQGATVNMTLTLPAFRADSTNCQLASTDSLTDLSSLSIYWSTTTSLTDSTLSATYTVSGQQGRPWPFSVNQPAWTTRYYWGITRDAANHRACKSNVLGVTTVGGVPLRFTDLRLR